MWNIFFRCYVFESFSLHSESSLWLVTMLLPCTSILCTVRAPVFGRHHFFVTWEHYRKAHGSLLSGWMNYNYTACCWFPTSSNILILPSQFWQIRFDSCWLYCSKCQILVLLWYIRLISKSLCIIWGTGSLLVLILFIPFLIFVWSNSTIFVTIFLYKTWLQVKKQKWVGSNWVIKELWP